MIVTRRPHETDVMPRDGDGARTDQPHGGTSDRDRASALARSLAGADMSCTVEARAGLALIGCDERLQVRLASAPARGAVLALAKQHGFTHIAVELAASPTT